MKISENSSSMGHIHTLSGNYVFYVIFSMYIHKNPDARAWRCQASPCYRYITRGLTRHWRQTTPSGDPIDRAGYSAFSVLPALTYLAAGQTHRATLYYRVSSMPCRLYCLKTFSAGFFSFTPGNSYINDSSPTRPPPLAHTAHTRKISFS